MRTNTATAETPPPAAVAPATSAKPAAKKAGLDFRNIGMKKSSGKKEYPALPDDLGTAGEIARNCRSIREEITALDGQKKTEDAELIGLVYQWFWQNYQGKAEVPSSVIVHIPAKDGEPASKILVTIPAKYKAVDPKELESAKARIIAAIGEQNYEGFFRDAFAIKIDGDLISAEHHQDFINELSALCEKFNCLDALEATPTIKTTKEFHTKRHQFLTADQNRDLNAVYPIIPMIKTKGVED